VSPYNEEACYKLCYCTELIAVNATLQWAAWGGGKTLHLCCQVLGSNPSKETGRITRGFHGFSQLAHENSWAVPPFKFIMHQSSYCAMLCSMTIWRHHKTSTFQQTGHYSHKGTLEQEAQQKKQTPWSESASELYRPSDRSLSAKWLPTFADKGCHVVGVTDPYSRILGFLDRSCYFSIK
jgi:hypothetical protein